METQDKSFLRILLYFLFGVAGCIIAGLFFFGPSMFSIAHDGFQFITVGIAGAMIFTIVRFYNKWAAALIVLVLALILLISFKVLKFQHVISPAVWALGTGYTLFGMACLFRTKVGKIPIGKFLLVGLAVSLFYVILVLLTMAPFIRPFPINALLINAVPGFFVGGGLGLGIEVGDLLGQLLTKEK